MNEGIGGLAAMNALLVHHGYRTKKEDEMITQAEFKGTVSMLGGNDIRDDLPAEMLD